MLVTIQKELFCVNMAEKTFLFLKLFFSMWNEVNGSNCNFKTMLFLTGTDDSEDCSNIQHFFIQFPVEEGESNCHPNKIDVSLICSGANLQ